MPRHAYAAIATIPTAHGPVSVRKAWASKQNTLVAILDGPTEALRACLPTWNPRSPTSSRVQVTPPRPIDLTTAMVEWVTACVPAWTMAANGEIVPGTAVNLITIKDSFTAAEKTMAATVRASTIGAYKKQFNRIGQHLPLRTHLASLTRDKVQTLVGSLAANGYAPTTIRSAVTALHRGLVPALDAGLVNAQVLQRIAQPKVITRTRQQMTRAQRDALLGVAGGHGRDAHLLFSIGLLAGLRRGELLALTWNNVDLDRLVLHVRNTASFVTKSGRARVVPIGAALLAILARYKPVDGEDGAFVLAPHKPVRKGMRWAFRKTFDKITTEAGVDWLSPHGMRRCFATLGAQAGISVWKLKGWLGHASVITTEGYADEARAFDPEVERLTG